MLPVLKRLIREIATYKKLVFVIAITGISYAVAYSQLLMIIRKIHKSFEAGEPSAVAVVGFAALGLAFLAAISRYFHIFLMNFVAESVVNDLRMKLHRKMMTLNLSFHTTYAAGSGGLLSRSVNDIRVIQDGLRMVADFFREPLLAVLLLGNLFYLNWKLTSTLIIVFPFILYFLRQISRSLRKYVLYGQESLEGITSTLKETLDGLRIIQSFNLEEEMDRKLKAQTDGYLQSRKKVHARVEIMSPVTEFVATGLILAIFFYFSSLVISGQANTGDVLAYIASLMMLNNPIKKLQESYVRIQETVVAGERVYALLDDGREVPQATSLQSFPQDFRKIRYNNVSFHYGHKPILKSIHLEIQKGEHVAFVGVSGSGKSSLVNLLPRFFDPTEGDVFLDDTPIRDIQLKELRRNVALVTQDVFLFSESIERNIWAGDFSKTPERIPASAMAANAHSFISNKPQQYQSLAGDKGGLLSGGEKQRISIARAIFKDAPILILDEATSALDSASELEVQKGIESLLEGRTALIIAHRLSTVQNCDRIYVMRDGEIVAQGKHRELLQNNSDYQKFCELQGLR